MQLSRSRLFNSLSEIYSGKIFDLDNNDHINVLNNKGWIFEIREQQIKRPDFLILEFDNRTILLELKKIEEKQKDKDVKKMIENMKGGKRNSVFYWVESYRKNLKEHIGKSNNQFKEFIKNNKEKFYKNQKLICNFSTVIILYSKRFIHDYTLPEIKSELYGKEVEDIDEYFRIFYYRKDRLLNINKYRAIGLIAVWDGKERFNIYNNHFTCVENNIPIFLTKKDINNFIIDEYFSEKTGISIFIIKKTSFERKEEIIYLIDNRAVSKENFIKELHLEINLVNKYESEQKEAFDNLFKKHN